MRPSRMSRLVDELLLLAHSDEQEFLRPGEIDVEPYVAELWEGVHYTADRHFELQVLDHRVEDRPWH